MGDLVRWAFRSQRRLLAVGAAIVALLLAGGAVAGRLGESAGTPASGPSAASSASSSALPGQTAVTVQAPPVRPFVQAALTFVGRWAALRPGQSPAEWRAALRPLVTGQLAAGLALTDTAVLPGGTPTGTATVRFAAQGSALVEVGLSTGRSVLVTLVSGPNGPQVADVQPAEGDTGSSVDPPAPAGSGAP